MNTLRHHVPTRCVFFEDFPYAFGNKRRWISCVHEHLVSIIIDEIWNSVMTEFQGRNSTSWSDKGSSHTELHIVKFFILSELRFAGHRQMPSVITWDDLRPFHMMDSFRTSLTRFRNKLILLWTQKNVKKTDRCLEHATMCLGPSAHRGQCGMIDWIIWDYDPIPRRESQ